MTFVIATGCCNDASCIPVCPVQCIRPRPGDPDFLSAEQLYIDPATCIDCGACMDECPVHAIHSEWDLPEELTDYLQVNADYFVDSPIESDVPEPVLRRSLPEGRPFLSIAVVGSGPAGCYAAAALSEIRGVSVSVFDRLPTPFGLLRSGVAPDHPDTKLIGERFGAVLARRNVSCFLDVEVGRDISIDELLQHHHAIIWAAGVDDDRRLNLPGEDLPGCVPARAFVAWYNGHPDHADDLQPLDHSRVVIIGNGNVAIDVARVLASPVSAFESTDMAEHALAALRGSAVREVVVAARRGPEHAAYTTSELLALAQDDNFVLVAKPDEVATLAATAGPRSAVLEAASHADPCGDRNITLRYGLTPVSIDGDDRVRSVTFRRSDGADETIDTGLVLRAIGYRGRPVDGLPFDDETGTLPNQAGSVYDPETGDSVVGVYCTGWIKRGATGAIGTNKFDSAETVATLLEDFEGGRLPDPVHDTGHLAELINARVPDAVDHKGWTRIDQHERAVGLSHGRPRVKIVREGEFIDVVRSVR